MSKSQRGAVAFLDILGYKSFMEANPDELAAENVLTFINSVRDVITSVKDPHENNDIKTPVHPIDTLVFSDTVVLTCSIEAGPAPASQTDALLGMSSFVYKVAVLSRHMFEFGLPVRGAIHYGDFKVMDHSFVGTALAAAHQKAEKLNLSAVVVSEDFLKIESELLKGNDIHEMLFHTTSSVVEKYNTPTKAGLTQCHLLNPTRSFISDKANFKTDLSKADLRDYVLASFWSHNKSMDASAEIKAQNTEQYLRFCRFRHPSYFS